MKKTKYLPINWIDGMKLVAEHFHHTHCHISEALQSIRGLQLTSDNYGLGEVLSLESENLSIELRGNSVAGGALELNACNVLTMGGVPIVYSRQLYGSYVPRIELNCLTPNQEEEVFYILLSSPSNVYIPAGTIDPRTEPLRHPYLLPEIKMHLVAVSSVVTELQSPESVVVGMLRVNSGIANLERNYVPPVQRIAYHQTLLKVKDRVAQGLRTLYSSAIEIYRKNCAEMRHSSFVDNTLALCRVLIDYHDTYLYEIDHMLEEQSPHVLVQRCTILSNRLSSTLRTLPIREYESLLQYYYDWTDIKPSEFEMALGAVSNLQYNHVDVYPAFVSIVEMLEKLEIIYRKMSELEYVGLIRENIIISDDSYEKEEKPRRTFRFLD